MTRQVKSLQSSSESPIITSATLRHTYLIGKREKNSSWCPGQKTILEKKKKISKSRHIKSASTLTILIRVGKWDVTETENNLEPHPKEEEEVFNEGPVSQVAQGVPPRWCRDILGRHFCENKKITPQLFGAAPALGRLRESFLQSEEAKILAMEVMPEDFIGIPQGMPRPQWQSVTLLLF